MRRGPGAPVLLFWAFAAFLDAVDKCLARNNLEGFALAPVLGPSVMAGKAVTEAAGHAVSAVRKHETPSSASHFCSVQDPSSRHGAVDTQEWGFLPQLNSTGNLVTNNSREYFHGDSKSGLVDRKMAITFCGSQTAVNRCQSQS